MHERQHRGLGARHTTCLEAPDVSSACHQSLQCGIDRDTGMFHGTLLCASSLTELAYPLGLPDKHRVRQAEKQAAVNDGRDGQELLLQGQWVRYQPKATVEYIIAIVRDP